MENIINEIKKYEYIIIYGAGLYGRTLLKWLKENKSFDSTNIFLAVTEKSKYDLYDDSIYLIDDLKEYNSKALVVLAVSEEKQGGMLEVIERLEFHKYISMTKDFYENIRLETDFFAGKAMELAEKNMDFSREILWGMNLDRTMAETAWLIKKDIKTNWAAVGNQYIYILIKAMDSGKFNSILDIGMGQTTKLITQYVRAHDYVKHVVVENCKEWIDFARESLDLCDKTEVLYLETGWGGEDGKCRIYKDFSSELSHKKFDLISIDGPQGYDMKRESRIDILSIIPECLSDSWVIMMDDVGREGEKNTLNRLLTKLEDNNIEYGFATYSGANKFAICTSKDNRFFCTI